jgi:hypothetical protein
MNMLLSSSRSSTKNKAVDGHPLLEMYPIWPQNEIEKNYMIRFLQMAEDPPASGKVPIKIPNQITVSSYINTFPVTFFLPHININ